MAGPWDEIEAELICTAINHRYGSCLSGYSTKHLLSSIQPLLHEYELQRPTELVPLLLDSPAVYEELIRSITVPVTSFFRDPLFFQAIRTKAIPLLRTQPFINIWHAGCATGEEVYSMAILLREEGLLERAHLYASDINQGSLAVLERGEYDLCSLKSAEEAYRISGGRCELSDYYSESGGDVTFLPEMRSRISVHHHDLTSDGALGEVHLAICRNVFIYFSDGACESALNALLSSLASPSLIAVGRHESISSRFVTPLCNSEQIYIVKRRGAHNRLKEKR